MDVKSVGKVLAIAAIIIAVGVMIAIPAMDGNSLEGAPTQFDENGIRYEVITPEGVSPGEVTVKQYLGKKPIGELILPDTVKEYTVTKISANAFRGCTELKSVTLPAGLTVIENHAFYGNTLMDVTNKGILPESLVSIGEGAFGLCPALGSNDNELVIPDGVSVLNNTVFHKCGKLAKVTLPSKLERIGDNTFDTCATMTLTSGIPDSVKSIGARAFAECANIGTINYPDSLTSVGDWAFYKCSILDFSNSSRSSAGSLTIGLKAFYLCKSLKNIPLPEKISVAESSFQSCNLMDIPGGGALTINSIGGSKAFSGCTALGTNGISIILSDKITDTVFETFLNCSSITAVHLSANLTTVSNNSFQGCTNMYVDNPGILPPKVTSVGSSGFSGCNNLGSAVSNHLVIPATFKEFKNNAFFDCGSIDLITFQTQSPPAHMNASLQVTKAGPVKKVAVYSLFDPSVYNNPHCRGDFVDLVWEKPLCATVGCEFPKGTITPGVGTHVVPIGWGFTLSVSPSPGYIAKVTSDVAFTKVGNTYTVKEVNTSIKMDVVFVETFTVNVDAGDGGMVMYSIEGDKPVKCTGSVTAEKGQTVHLEAVQDGKHTFGSWSNGQIVAGIDVVSASDLAVNWLNIFRVSLDGCDYGKVFYNIGGVDFTEYEGVLTLDTGSSVHMKAVANEGYRLYEWSDKVTVTERIFDSETHLSLKWMKTYSILVSQSPGGTLKLAENKHNVYDVGSNVQITAVPDKGYRLKELYVNGASVAFSDNTYTIKNLAADSSVTAEWIQQFRVDLTTAKGGTISFQNEKPDVSSKLFDIGADVNLVFTPSEGYSPNTLILDGVETKVTDGKYTIRSISANHTVAATWIKQYVVEFTTNEGGRVSFLAWDNGIKSRKFDEGSKVVITAVPQDGYVLASLTVNGNSAELKGDRYIIEKLSENTKLVFTWQKTFAVTVDLVPGGKVMWKIDGQYAEYVSPVKAVSGKIVWLKAVPNDDHRFVKWSDEKTTEEVSYIDAAKVSPVWMKRYTVSIVNTEGGTVKFLGDPSSTKKFDAGTDVVLEITANPGYALSQFTVGGTTAKVTDGKHTITNINADCEAKALWVKQFDVSLKTTAGGSINFSGKGSDVTVFTFDAGSKVV
ncbi:MAG: leucine-rich repeat domain-containing protein, partial [Candidatus Methanomethylophilaceae archaeon]|nr:leucine-rich repeat domain-containing protein [Candidatus Methanomethylophilaceae archaeon]